MKGIFSFIKSLFETYFKIQIFVYFSDLYTFDCNEDEANKTYEKVCNAYERIFKRLDLSVVKGIKRSLLIFV